MNVNEEQILAMLLSNNTINKDRETKTFKLKKYESAIIKARENGRTWQDIKQILQKNGFEISVGLLVKHFLNLEKEKRNLIVKNNKINNINVYKKLIAKLYNTINTIQKNEQIKDIIVKALKENVTNEEITNIANIAKQIN